METLAGAKSSKSKAVLISVLVALFAVSSSALYAVAVHQDGSVIFSLSHSRDGDFYYLTVEGNDHFEDMYMSQGSSVGSELNQFLMDNVTCGQGISRFSSGWCSAFITPDADGSGYLAGRSYDYYQTIPCAVYCKGDGTNTYSSVSMVDLAMFCDLGEDYFHMVRDTRLNAAAYIPLDGVNEKGVFICINAVNNGVRIDQCDEGKLNIFATSALRVVLNHADSAAEAAELISGLNLHCVYNFHFFTCDDTGAGYAVEIYDGKTYVTETKLMTNHYLTEAGKDTPVTESSATRFSILEDTMTQHPEMDKDMVKQALISVKQENPDHIHYTRWSVVYDLEEKNATVYIRVGDEVRYDRGYEFGIAGA